jgi:FkbM family methyltransferase
LNLARAVGPSGKVYCLEANPELIDVLRHNVEANGYADRVEIFHMGIWKEDGQLRFPVRAKSLGGAGFKSKSRNPFKILKARRKVKAWVDVRVTSLPSFCRDHAVDFVRMDVEGAEYDVLLASRALLAERELTIVMEWLPKNTTRADTRRLYDVLHDAGFRVYRITDEGLVRIDSGDDLFDKHESAWRGGQRDVLCRKGDLGPSLTRWWPR